ncbi:MAG TPA: hypothetical protein VGS58_06415 [Candidatus Sulfopaludibacter sp.]|nr:hypothetical protein [Candidatus Sulfopaludibacter sp.]
MPAASLRALLANLIDYAGLYPPSSLPLDAAAAKYNAYLDGPESWMLNRMVLPSGKPFDPHWRVALVVEARPEPLPPMVETLESKQALKLSLPTYCEVPLDRVPPGAFAKVRTGGLAPDAIPAPEQLADFLLEAAARRTPFKATAGLHHPIRSLHPLTYAPDAPQAVMHGFVNVFTAAAFAWHAGTREIVLDIVNDVDPNAFSFREAGLVWRGRALSTSRIAEARRDFAHSFGSCSFEEPIADLRELGWL